MVETRSDITYATLLVNRFINNPSHQHTEAVKIILKYLKGLKNKGITYGGETKLNIEGYLDSNWAGDKESQRSPSGFIFMLNVESVSWCSKKQVTVAISSTEAKYITLTQTTKKVI